METESSVDFCLANREFNMRGDFDIIKGSCNKISFIRSLNFVANFVQPLLFVYIPLGYQFYLTKNIVWLALPICVFLLSLFYFV